MFELPPATSYHSLYHPSLHRTIGFGGVRKFREHAAMGFCIETTIPETNELSPKNEGFQVQNLLFQGSLFSGAKDVSFREGRCLGWKKGYKNSWDSWMIFSPERSHIPSDDFSGFPVWWDMFPRSPWHNHWITSCNIHHGWGNLSLFYKNQPQKRDFSIPIPSRNHLLINLGFFFFRIP